MIQGSPAQGIKELRWHKGLVSWQAKREDRSRREVQLESRCSQRGTGKEYLMTVLFSLYN